MTLIEQMMEPCVIMNAVKVADGQGGFNVTYVAGAEILAAIVNDTSMQARIGEAQGVKATYTITTSKANALDFHDIIQRANGDVFRVTNNSRDKLSPVASSLDIAQCGAEKWSL